MGVRQIRPFRVEDLPALYDICLRTGAAGGDASELVEHAELFGALYAAPYGVLEPEHAFVLDDGVHPIGYVLGALDTAAFEARCEVEWWPPLRRRFPLTDGRTLDDLLMHLIHHRAPLDHGLLRDYPSHLHIDLLPEAQGAGWGRRMLDALYAALTTDGSTGVHWGVSTSNERALAFYRRLDATELHDDGAIVTFGQSL